MENPLAEDAGTLASWISDAITKYYHQCIEEHFDALIPDGDREPTKEEELQFNKKFSREVVQPGIKKEDLEKATALFSEAGLLGIEYGYKDYPFTEDDRTFLEELRAMAGDRADKHREAYMEYRAKREKQRHFMDEIREYMKERGVMVVCGDKDDEEGSGEKL